MKKLPIGIQNIREILRDGFLYVDKTQHVYDLLNDTKHYFLSRPRRFGKSLLLDTIKEVLSGNRELFKGLWIYDSDCEFPCFPVLLLDMSSIDSSTSERLSNSLILELKKREKEEGFDFEKDLNFIFRSPSDLLKTLIEGLYKKYDSRVVVLIDEYDKPILDHIDSIEKAEANREVLRDFYGVLKPMDPYLRMTFITGITKFTKTSLFSGFNNLLDITLKEKYSNICGIAIEDLESYFSGYIERLAALEWFQEVDSLHDKILEWYDGYSWDGKTRVINPFVLLYFFSMEKFGGYWYASGSPTLLTKLIKKDPSAYTELSNLMITETMLDMSELDGIEPGLLMFQTGYLTVKEKVSNKGVAVYHMSIPNFEVRQAFDLQVVTAFTEKNQSYVDNSRLLIASALQNGDLETVLGVFRGLFASIPYQLHIGQEAYYHSLFYAVLNMLGFQIDAEVSVSGGRVDAILELKDKVYIIEFKYVDCAMEAEAEVKQNLTDNALEEGMNQIKSRGYANKYTSSNKAVYLAAFAFLGRQDIEMKTELFTGQNKNSID